jgi:diguanylate cyclase (GGDEF)-like protein
VTTRKARRTAGARALRARLVASIIVAALLPFLAAWWIADEYVGRQASTAAETRLAYTLRGAAREAGIMLDHSRTRAVELARSPALQRAAARRDRAALARLLRPGEVVRLPARAGKPRLVVGRPTTGAPAVPVSVVARGRTLAVVSVSGPSAAALIRAAGEAAVLPGSGDAVAALRGARGVAGSSDARGGRLGSDGRIHAGGGSLRAGAVLVPGYDPPLRLVAVTTGTAGIDETSALRRRLAIAALASLLAIGLYAITLARPLLRGIGRVESVAEQAMLDPLTGVANRRGFERSMTIELERSRRRGHAVALVLVDLDDFKGVNDRHGHAVGDEVLVMLADQLHGAVRSADTVARLGGEEFAVLLPETTLEGAVVVAERARVALERSEVYLRGGKRLAVTASFGAAAFPGSPDRAMLLQDADAALYRAKRLGKNRVCSGGRAVVEVAS